MDEATTYDVRVYKIEVRKGKAATSYHVRWRAGHKTWKTAFRNTRTGRQLPKLPAGRRPQR